QTSNACLRAIVNDALMPAFHQASHHIGAHLAKSDHSELHLLASVRAALMLTLSGENMSPTNIIVEHEAELSHVFAEWLDVALADCVRQRGRASLALPGGSVAEAFLPAVAEKVRDWSHIHVFWGDER